VAVPIWLFDGKSDFSFSSFVSFVCCFLSSVCNSGSVGIVNTVSNWRRYLCKCALHTSCMTFFIDRMSAATRREIWPSTLSHVFRPHPSDGAFNDSISYYCKPYGASNASRRCSSDNHIHPKRKIDVGESKPHAYSFNAVHSFIERQIYLSCRGKGAWGTIVTSLNVNILL
jgi:hypothetical protein